MLFVTVSAATWAPKIIPARFKVFVPACGWLGAMAVMWNYAKTPAAMVFVIQCVMAYEANKRLGFSSSLLNRLVYAPLGASCLSAFLPLKSEATNHPFIGLTILAVQVWSAFGGLVMMACLPASVMTTFSPQADRDRVRDNVSERLSSSGCTVIRSNVSSPANAMLDIVVVKRKTPTERWLMYSGGNAEFLESSLYDMNILGATIDANVILFNPRGIGNSTGYVSHLSDLVEDAACVAQHCIREYHIDPRKLLLLGHSIGGGVVSELAAKHLRSSPVVIDRSFSKLSDAAANFSLFPPGVTKMVFPLLVGDLDSVRAWNSIEHPHKLIIFARRDEIINYMSASIARLNQFAQGGPEFEKVIELHGGNVPSWHNCNFSAFEEKQDICARIVSFYPSE